MTDTPVSTPSDGGTWPAVESTWDRSRKEWNLLVRRPFYINLRLGMTQNALWVGRRLHGPFRTVFNRLRDA